MRTIEAAVQFIIDNGIHYADGECERIVNNAGGFTHAYGLAILSMQASPVPLNPNYAVAPDGALHYWTNVWGHWGSYGYCDAGHVMFGYQGLLWGDSGAITTKYNNARFAGSVTKADLERRKSNLRYAGWTPYHGPETLAGVSTAAASAQSLNNTMEEDMARIIVVDDGPEANVTYLLGGGRLSLIQPGDQIALASALQVVAATGADAGYFHVSGQQISYIKAFFGYGVTVQVGAPQFTDAQIAALATQVAAKITIPPAPAAPVPPTAADIAAAVVKVEGAALSNG